MPPKAKRPSEDEREDNQADEGNTATATAEPPRVLPPTIPTGNEMPADPAPLPDFKADYDRLVGEGVIRPNDEKFFSRTLNHWFISGKPVDVEAFLRETFAGNPSRDVREIRAAARPIRPGYVAEFRLPYDQLVQQGLIRPPSFQTTDADRFFDQAYNHWFANGQPPNVEQFLREAFKDNPSRELRSDLPPGTPHRDAPPAAPPKPRSEFDEILSGLSSGSDPFAEVTPDEELRQSLVACEAKKAEVAELDAEIAANLLALEAIDEATVDPEEVPDRISSWKFDQVRSWQLKLQLWLLLLPIARRLYDQLAADERKAADEAVKASEQKILEGLIAAGIPRQDLIHGGSGDKLHKFKQVLLEHPQHREARRQLMRLVQMQSERRHEKTVLEGIARFRKRLAEYKSKMLASI